LKRVSLQVSEDLGQPETDLRMNMHEPRQPTIEMAGSDEDEH